MLKKIFTWIFRKELQAVDQIVIKLEKQSIKVQDLHDKLEREYINARNTRLIVQQDLERLNTIFGNIEVSLDHGYHDNWAVISIAGEKSDYIRFVDLRDRDLRAIQDFLRQFDRSKIDTSPQFRPYFIEAKRTNEFKKRK